MDFDYLFLEALLIDRLKSLMDADVNFIGGLPDLAAMDDQVQHASAVYVIYLGDQLRSTAKQQGAQRAVQMLNQNWAVVIALSVADANNDGEEARRQAGPLIGKLLTTLTGWKPSIDVGPLARSPRPTPPGYTDGFFYYPFVFTAEFMFPRK